MVVVGVASSSSSSSPPRHPGDHDDDGEERSDDSLPCLYYYYLLSLVADNCDTRDQPSRKISWCGVPASAAAGEIKNKLAIIYTLESLKI